MKVTILTNPKVSTEANKGESLLFALRRMGYALPAACGGGGKCGKCKVTIVNSLGQENVVNACGFLLEEDVCVKLPKEYIVDFGIPKTNNLEPISRGSQINLAVDIGTTTVAYSLFAGDEKICQGGFLNPQCSYGADVLSRISACENHLEELALAIRKPLAELCENLGRAYNFEKIYKVYAVGNTTMLHIFKGEDPSSLGAYPYAPKFLSEQVLQGKDVALPMVEEVVLAPGFSAFVGGDITAGAVAAHMQNGDLLVDIGTNGEILFKSDDKFYCTSAAAGPAFEGGNIECGMGGTVGAINRVLCQNGKMIAKTIGNCKACGITGSGLADALAVFLSQGKIQPSGAIIGGDKLEITNGIYISQRDIRNFQLAKSALRSALDLLLSSAKSNCFAVKNLYLAGGMGNYLDVQSAVALGIFPAELAPKIKPIGNSALAGAELCLLDASCRQHAKELTASPTILDLSSSSDFYSAYLQNLKFSD